LEFLYSAFQIQYRKTIQTY